MDSTESCGWGKSAYRSSRPGTYRGSRICSDSFRGCREGIHRSGDSGMVAMWRSRVYGRRRPDAGGSWRPCGNRRRFRERGSHLRGFGFPLTGKAYRPGGNRLRAYGQRMKNVGNRSGFHGRRSLRVGVGRRGSCIRLQTSDRRVVMKKEYV